jgi:hypothetical protein
MTDQSVPVLSVEPQKSKVRKPYFVPSHAVVKMFSTVKLTAV